MIKWSKILPVVSAYLLVRIEGKLEQLQQSIHELTRTIEKWRKKASLRYMYDATKLFTYSNMIIKSKI